MSPRSEQSKHSIKSKPTTGSVDQIFVIRLAVAAVLLAIAVIVSMPTMARIVLIILSLAAAAYDLVLESMDAVLDGKYFSDPLLILAIALIALLFGFGAEGAGLVLVYQATKLCRRLAEKITRDSGRSLLKRASEETVQQMEETLADSSALKLSVQDDMTRASTLVLRGAMVFAILYAILLPLLSGFGYRVSVHRGLMILAACIPGSVVAALPMTGLIGLCHAAGRGVAFSKAEQLEKLGDVNVAIFDKDGVFSAGEPQVLGVQSAIDRLDDSAFLNMAAHASYYSEQPFAKAIKSYADPEYQLDVISDFEDIPGGVKLMIGPSPIILAKAESFRELGIVIPEDPSDKGQVYYMTLAGRYIGKILLSDEVDPNSDGIVGDLKSMGVKRTILLSEGTTEEAQRLGNLIGVTETYSECDTERKLKLIDDLKQGPRNQVLFLYANGVETHTAADLDLRISHKSKYADAVIQPGSQENLPFTVLISRRMKDVAVKNAVFVMVMKAIMIFLSILGYSQIWFVLFIDSAAMLATILNAIRVTQDSVLNRILKR